MWELQMLQVIIYEHLRSSLQVILFFKTYMDLEQQILEWNDLAMHWGNWVCDIKKNRRARYSCTILIKLEASECENLRAAVWNNKTTMPWLKSHSLSSFQCLRYLHAAATWLLKKDNCVNKQVYCFYWSGWQVYSKDLAAPVFHVCM